MPRLTAKFGGLGLGMGLGGGRRQFSPAQLNPEFWIKADGVNYQEPARTNISGDTDPVGSYSDITANARHFDQSTTSAKPTLNLDEFNGLPGVNFDGGDSVRSPAYSPPLDGVTIAMAINPTDVAGNKGVFEFRVDGMYNIIFFVGSGAMRCIFPSNGLIRLNETYGAISAGIQTLIITIGDDKRTVEMFLNNVSIGTGVAADDITLVGASSVGVGVSDTLLFPGDITEMFKFNTVATTVERAQMQTYLSRWLP